MKKTTAFFSICTLCLLWNFACLGRQSTSTWAESKEQKKGTIAAYWYDSNPFIVPTDGQNPSGIEYEILNKFQEYIRTSHGVELKIDWIRTNGFSDTYNRIKNQDEIGSFGLSAFSITPERAREVNFSPPYLGDISVLISSKDVPIVKNTEEFKKVFSQLDAVSIASTTYVDYLNDLKTNHNLDFNIELIPSIKSILTEVAEREGSFGYIDLPNYLMGLNQGVNTNRQNLFAIRKNGYALIMPKNSDWLIPITEFFTHPNFEEDAQNIINKYLGTEIHDLMENISLIENEQIILLTKEKEIQDRALVESALKVQRQTTLRNLFIFGFAFVLVMSILIYRSYVVKTKAHQMLKDQRNQIAQQRQDIANQNTQLEERNTELSTLNKELIDLNREKNELISMLSHDLRTPANNILGLANVYQLENKNLTESQRHLIENISGESARLNSMISKILDLEAIEAHRTNIKYESIVLSNLLNKVVTNFGIILENKGLKVEKRFDETLSIQGDRLYTMLIFENLISNAIKYSDKEKTIELTLEQVEDKVRCTVKDHGPGLKPEDQQVIFEKFQRPEAKPLKGQKSYGLGLSIVKKYVEEMKGTVWCESQLGQGASFFVEFDQYSDASVLNN